MARIDISGVFKLQQATPRQLDRVVVAAVCYRIRGDRGIEFLLVRTAAGRWTFPKGAVDGDPTAAAAAAREAHEEAGVVGRVQTYSFTTYLHGKSNGLVHMVQAHLCEVMHVGPRAEAHRVPTWFSVDEAKQRLCQNRTAPLCEELERVVDTAVRRLQS